MGTDVSISLDDTFELILQKTSLNEYEEYILPTVMDQKSINSIRKLSLKEFSRLAPTWDMTNILNGLITLSRIKSKGNTVIHKIWSDKNIADVPNKDISALFHFPAECQHDIHDIRTPYILIVPGGAYSMVASIQEGFPVARKLNKLGFSVFILHYRVGRRNLFPASLQDLEQAISYINERSGLFRINPCDYLLMGFSAGGHLAALSATENYSIYNCKLSAPRVLILSYAVINFEESNDIMNLCKTNCLGTSASRKGIKSLDVSRHIGKQYPPTFLWHCCDDRSVPISNAEKMERALAKNNIVHETRFYRCGGHGIGLGSGTQAEGWIEDAVNFSRKHRFLSPDYKLQ